LYLFLCLKNMDLLGMLHVSIFKEQNQGLKVVWMGAFCLFFCLLSFLVLNF
jgi:hypothetical protein